MNRYPWTGMSKLEFVLIALGGFVAGVLLAALIDAGIQACT